MKVKDAGQIRSSEIITTYGPGAIFNGKNGLSVMLLGLDFWPESKEPSDNLSKFKPLQNKFLEDVCDKDHFRMPLNNDKSISGIPCIPYPGWGYCSFCKLMGEIKDKPDEKTGEYHCKYCLVKYTSKNKMLAARLILICKYGHVAEFPWIEWAHSEKKDIKGKILQTAEICDKPILRWSFSKRGTTLSAYTVSCQTCGRFRSMANATQPIDDIVLPSKDKPGEFMDLKCDGNTPWLSPNSNKKSLCPPRTVVSRQKVLLRGNHIRASNMYFPMIVSALQIPRFQNPIQQVIAKNKAVIDDCIFEEDSYEKISGKKIFSNSGFSVEDIIRELKYRYDEKVYDEKGIKSREFADIVTSDTSHISKNKVISISDVPIHDEIKTYVSRIKKIDRLTMITVLKSFTRNQPPDPFDQTSSKNEKIRCKLNRNQKINWIPGVETKGEGILFSLDEDKLKKWEEIANSRCNSLLESFEEYNALRGWEGNISTRYILLHTLAHILIRELAYTSGYGESSIRERIYCEKNTNGILLYTASNSSEGSLGGIVRNAETDEFYRLLKGAIKKSTVCSRDPLCIESKPNEGPAHTKTNGSACYACSLLPETSCENFNQLLDRKIISDQSIGFFGDFK